LNVGTWEWLGVGIWALGAGVDEAMRIIAGRLKGRRLKAPSWDGLRPTSDKLRETLFNILAPRIDGARVLDGFAGTGAVGIEAISRGAAHVTFIEQDRRAVALIEENLAACGVAGGYTIQRGDAAIVLPGLATNAFDLILLDPPYDITTMTAVLDASARALSSGGLVVLEHATRREPAGVASLEPVRQVKSGDSTLTFFAARRLS
jgi:16S rRNA (guanine966-N2)-methyltransferase